MKWISFILFFTSITSLIAQDEQAARIIHKNNIKSIETYFHPVNSDSSSAQLTSIEHYNKAGYRIDVSYFKEKQCTNAYTFKYLHDSTLIERKSFYKNKLNIITRYSYDSIGNYRKAMNYDSLGVPKNFYFITSFNTNHQETECKAYDYDIITFHNQYKYYKTGQLKERKILFPTHLKGSLFFYKNGDQINTKNAKSFTKKKEIWSTNHLTLQMKEISNSYFYNTITFCINGQLTITKGDIIKTQSYFNDSELIHYKKEFVNNKPIGILRYHYKMFE